MKKYTKEEICSALDYAVLKPTTTQKDIERACALANKHKIKSVCVAPIYVPLACSMFWNVSTTIGFPHGNTSPSIKAMEAWLAIEAGAMELDVVVNYSQFLDGNASPIREELKEIVRNAHHPSRQVIVKAILETCYYTTPQLIKACRILERCGVNFVKTSTGFTGNGATRGVVNVLRNAIKDMNSDMQIKASGGIKTYEDVCIFLDMGCTRVGSGSFHSLLPIYDYQRG